MLKDRCGTLQNKMGLKSNIVCMVGMHEVMLHKKVPHLKVLSLFWVSVSGQQAPPVLCCEIHILCTSLPFYHGNET